MQFRGVSTSRTEFKMCSWYSTRYFDTSDEVYGSFSRYRVCSDNTGVVWRTLRDLDFRPDLKRSQYCGFDTSGGSVRLYVPMQGVFLVSHRTDVICGGVLIIDLRPGMFQNSYFRMLSLTCLPDMTLNSRFRMYPGTYDQVWMNSCCRMCSETCRQV